MVRKRQLGGVVAKLIGKGISKLKPRKYKSRYPTPRKPKVKVIRKKATSPTKEAKRKARTAKRGVQSKKVKALEKRLLPKVVDDWGRSNVRARLKGKSAGDIADKYTGAEISTMKRKLNQATTPNASLINRLDRARKMRQDTLHAIDPGWEESALRGGPGNLARAKKEFKFKQHGGKVSTPRKKAKGDPGHYRKDPKTGKIVMSRKHPSIGRLGTATIKKRVTKSRGGKWITKQEGGPITKAFIGGLVGKGASKIISRGHAAAKKAAAKKAAAKKAAAAKKEVKVKMIPEGKRTHSEAQMKKLVQKKGKLIPKSDRLASERKANVPSHLRAKRGTKSIPPRKRRGGGKIQYRSIGGKVLDGNDITNMIYD